ncbi:MAG: hypothetical protein H8E25_08780 [Planctomycetes bacterium]|nr:hypothetical protein [Planctomycetota bacterium]
MAGKLTLVFWIAFPLITLFTILLFSPRAEYEVTQQPLPEVIVERVLEYAKPFSITVVDEHGKEIGDAVVLFTQPELHQSISDEYGVARTTFYNLDNVHALAYARGYKPSAIVAVSNNGSMLLEKKSPLPETAAPLAEIFPRKVQLANSENVSFANCMMLVRPQGDEHAEPFIYFADETGSFNLDQVPGIDLDCRVYPPALPAIADTMLKKFVLQASQKQIVINGLATQRVAHQGLRANALYRLESSDLIALVRSSAQGDISIGPLPAAVNYSIKLND